MKLVLTHDIDPDTETPARPEQWMDLALCAAEADPEIFFPKTRRGAAKAKAVCARCAVVNECLTYARTHDIREGVWGGLHDTERTGHPG